MTVNPAPPGSGTTGARPLWQRSVIIMAAITALLFVIEAVDAAGDFRMDYRFGIISREVYGLDGIAWSPLLHADWAHLIGNLTVGVVLGFLLLLARRFLIVTAVVWIVSGVGVWLFGPSDTATVGASGVIFGWLTYLLLRGLFNRNIWQILGGLVLFAIYGSILWGVLPTDPTVSWQGHLFGAFGGVIAAWFLADRDRRKSKKAATQQFPGVRS
ncbi:rhomboid family intramembrane serine protease [Gordonia sp. LSe1-13]|uniref:Rhomboid family intramembrane serine protease n=1 Tax=Gordonia sesuvii TaxID=3116777 RepID=A0ABU7MCI4_9ACTN|nr:rhomboid family intramembrane serine protease [Gordonia sp. LSe1-13]